MISLKHYFLIILSFLFYKNNLTAADIKVLKENSKRILRIINKEDHSFEYSIFNYFKETFKNIEGKIASKETQEVDITDLSKTIGIKYKKDSSILIFADKELTEVNFFDNN